MKPILAALALLAAHATAESTFDRTYCSGAKADAVEAACKEKGLEVLRDPPGTVGTCCVKDGAHWDAMNNICDGLRAERIVDGHCK